MNWPLGRPVAVYGLKFLTKAGSPEPAMTRQVWPAWTEPAPKCEAGADAVAISATSAARPAIAAIPARRRLKRTSRPIVQFLSCPEAGDAERQCVVPATFPAFVTTA